MYMTNCIICGEKVEIGINEDVKVCDKCKSAVMTMRAKIEFFDKACEETREEVICVPVNLKEKNNDKRRKGNKLL